MPLSRPLEKISKANFSFTFCISFQSYLKLWTVNKENNTWDFSFMVSSKSWHRLWRQGRRFSPDDIVWWIRGPHPGPCVPLHLKEKKVKKMSSNRWWNPRWFFHFFYYSFSAFLQRILLTFTSQKKKCHFWNRKKRRSCDSCQETRFIVLTLTLYLLQL